MIKDDAKSQKIRAKVVDELNDIIIRRVTTTWEDWETGEVELIIEGERRHPVVKGI